MSGQEWKNRLYFGDNLTILREHVADESVDLIYLDPPFNSNATYNVLFGEKDGSHSQAQITAFDDTWHWGDESEQTYREIAQEGRKKLSDLIQALRSFLGRNDMMAYLVMMAARLAELHKVLKPTGSIYLHCDSTASHYLKLILDATFGVRCFQNELIWKRTSARSDSHRYNRIDDRILFYSKSDDFLWNPQFTSYDDAYVDKFYSHVEPETGRRFMIDNLTASGTRQGSSGKTWRGISPAERGNHWKYTIETLEELDKAGRIYWPAKEGGVPRYKRYLDKMPGLSLQSIWTDISPISAHAKERLHYPTQKPESLLERVIKASSNEGDLVLDPFCGCGTTINVAERLHRRWIGIDITHLAIALIKNRLQTTFQNELSPYEVIGSPRDLSSAHALAETDRYQFEWWALSLVDARPAQDKKKGADSGIDGYINFFDDGSGKAKKIIVQVKSGHVTRNQIGDLKNCVDREKATMGAFLTLEQPTKPMMNEALAAGYYAPEHLAKEHTAPKIQILTIADLLNGAQLRYPRMLVSTFKQAPRKFKEPAMKQGDLGLNK